MRLEQIALLNSTIQYLFVELLGRVGLGLGVLQYATYEMGQVLALDAKSFPSEFCRELRGSFSGLSSRAILPIFQEVDSDDRRAFDEVIFDSIELPKRERKEVYDELARLVEMRLTKATGGAKESM